MKRYRVLVFDFDFRSNILLVEINEDWDECRKAAHLENQNIIRESLKAQFGADDFDRKLRDFIDIGPKVFSISAFHNRFLEQVRKSFVIAAYYPALVGACALGERILNHLLISLRDDFKHTSEYKKVYSKNSFLVGNLTPNR
jgi:hypothetical protein